MLGGAQLPGVLGALSEVGRERDAQGGGRQARRLGAEDNRRQLPRLRLVGRRHVHCEWLLWNN